MLATSAVVEVMRSHCEMPKNKHFTSAYKRRRNVLEMLSLCARVPLCVMSVMVLMNTGRELDQHESRVIELN